MVERYNYPMDVNIRVCKHYEFHLTHDRWDDLLHMLIDAQQTSLEIVEGNAKTSFVESWKERSYLRLPSDLKSMLFSW